jgi:hypothetical protein
LVVVDRVVVDRVVVDRVDCQDRVVVVGSSCSAAVATVVDYSPLAVVATVRCLVFDTT